MRFMMLMLTTRVVLWSVAVFVLSSTVSSEPRRLETGGQASAAITYRVLATSKTSTMEKELNEAAEAGFRFHAVMGGETAFGGNEVVVVMGSAREAQGRFAYKLLATSKTSTMQKELQEAADAGFEYKGQTVFSTLFGGDEVVVILERDKDAAARGHEYRLVATSKTSTLQKELLQTGADGFDLLAMTVSKTALGGSELVAITRRPRATKAQQQN